MIIYRCIRTNMCEFCNIYSWDIGNIPGFLFLPVRIIVTDAWMALFTWTLAPTYRLHKNTVDGIQQQRKHWRSQEQVLQSQ